jgi:hypothetical protein
MPLWNVLPQLFVRCNTNAASGPRFRTPLGGRMQYRMFDETPLRERLIPRLKLLFSHAPAKHNGSPSRFAELRRYERVPSLVPMPKGRHGS